MEFALLDKVCYNPITEEIGVIPVFSSGHRPMTKASLLCDRGGSGRLGPPLTRGRWIGRREMRLLPSEQAERIERAIIQFSETGDLVINEPCDCGSHVRHNNGGNYHDIIFLRHDSGRAFVKYETTCELTPPAEREACGDPEQVIRNHADWL